MKLCRDCDTVKDPEDFWAGQFRCIECDKKKNKDDIDLLRSAIEYLEGADGP